MASRVASRALAIPCLLAVLAMTGCEFVIADWYYIDRPRAMGTSVEVIELGPLWPQRVGFDPLEPPITEPMPGDRVRLSPLLVDGEGRPIDPASVDALWFQCGTDRCIRDGGQLLEGLDTRCSDLHDWTMDSGCRLGSGGSLVMIVPPIGQLTVFTRYAYYYMVAAVDDSRTAEECWAARQSSDAPLDGCVFADRELKVGPSWVLLVEAALEGLEQDIPVTEIPFAAFGQVSNRLPVLAWIELTNRDGSGARQIFESSGPVQVDPGDQFRVGQPPFRPLYDGQVYFAARETLTPDSYVFLPMVESLWVEWYTSGSLVRIDEGNLPGVVELLIDELAKPGSISRLVVIWGDDRGSEGMRVIEFEVRE